MASSRLVKDVCLRAGILFLVKFIGFFARIPLFRMIGPEGIGLYQMIYAFYAFVLTAVMGGLPTALALTTAGDPRQGSRLLIRFSFLFLLFGAGMSFFCYALSDRLAGLMGNRELGFAIRCTAPAITAVPLLGLLRGYLQGKERHGTLAVSELIEQAVRIAVLLFLAAVWVHAGAAYAVGGAMLGAFAGAAVAMVFLLAMLSQGRQGAWGRSLLQKSFSFNEMYLFFYSSLSISAARLMVPFSDFADALIVPHRLQTSGLSLAEATSIYGEITGMGSLIVYLPSLITSALAFALSTRLTSEYRSTRGETFQELSFFSLEAAMMWGIGSALFLYACSEDLSVWFYSDPTAAKAIRYLCLAPLLAGIREITTVILWAAGRQRTPLVGLILGFAASLLCNYTLTAIPGFGYAGTAIGLLAMETVSVLWNLIMIAACLPLALSPLFLRGLILCCSLLASLWLLRNRLYAWHLYPHVETVAAMLLVYAVVLLFLLYRWKRHGARSS